MGRPLFKDGLFSKLLIEPAQNYDVSDLYIVSGYASSAMAFHHSEKLRELNLNVALHLIVGMAGKDGLSQANHLGFQNLMQKQLLGSFECCYLVNDIPAHSKVYSWVKGNKPKQAFAGSVNYSQQAFVGGFQREVATECDPLEAYDYYQSLISQSIYCTHQDAEEVITLYNDNRTINSNQNSVEEENGGYTLTTGLEKITVTLINKDGEISKRSGLNWGQRDRREPNQAYIPLKAGIYNSNFFPPIGQHFTINTDDGKILICSRAQQNGKAIHSPHNNSLLGEYFRNRLGIANGELVTMDDLLRYGRTDIDFYKVDEENYYMDFSVK